MEMEPECQQRRLGEVRARLALDTDPHQLRKALKTLSTLPIATEVLREIRFRKAVKHARKHGLLLGFSRALASKWPDLFPEVEASPEPGPQDSELSRWTRQPRKAPEDGDRAPAPRGEAEDPSARSSSCSDGVLSSGKNPRELGKPPGGLQNLPRRPESPERTGEGTERPSEGRLPLGGGLQVGTAGSAKGARTGPQGPGDRGESATRKSSGPDSGRGKRRSRSPSLGPKSARPGPSQGQPGRSFEECLEDLGSPRGRSQGKRARKAAAPPPGAGPQPGDAQLCRRGSAHCVAQPACAAAGPESREQPQLRFPVDDPALWSPFAEQEAPLAPVVRVNSRTPVFSGTKRGRPPAEPHARRPADATQDPRDCLSQAAGPDLQPLPESQEQRLQALRARIRRAQAEKQLQARQTKRICFNGGPGPESGPGQETSENPGASASAKRSPRPASAGLPPTGAPAPPSAHSKKPPAKKPAPLMAKALRDYKTRFSRR